MSLNKINPRTVLLLLFISIIAILRTVLNFSEDISPVANFSPIGAMALFGGAYFKKWWKAFAFPLLMLFISDLILHQTVYKTYGNAILYGSWYWVYGAFALMTLAGKWIIKEVSVKSFVLATITCVFIHWTVTDIGVWYGSKKFSQDLAGYFDCLILAIPYEWRFLIGTLIYGTALFAVFEWMQNKYQVLKTI